MAAKLIVVLGATGNQGGSVVKTLLNDPEWKIRGISRNASSEASEKLKAQGVEMVSASLDDVASLEKAFQGAYAIFSVTDFWGLYFNPATHAGKPADVAANEWVKRIEIQQGKNVFDAAAKVEGLQRLVFSSLPNVLNSSGGRIKHVMHFDSKALAVEYGQATYPELWKKTSVILVGLYLSNVLSSPFLEPKKVGS
jgi:nucleoside-diphosphate-sugar epimerase